MKRALAGRGIQLYRDDNCAPGALAALSNTAVPYERQEAVISSEGDIHCDLYPEDVFGSRIERFVWRNDHEPTYVSVLNVGCAIYAQRLANTDSLERGLRRLPGVSALPAKVPSSDAMPDALARSDR